MRKVIAGSLTLVIALAHGGIAAAQTRQPTPVRVGITNVIADVGFFVADKRGYFAQEGLKVEFIPFAAAARMITALGSGELEVGGGGVAAGLFNAVGRGIGLKIVADKNTSTPVYGAGALMVRKDHVDSGRYKSLKDFRGFRIALPAPGTATSNSLDRAFDREGLSLKDMEPVYLSFPQMVTAFENKAIDGGFLTEPMVSTVLARGLAVRLIGDDEIFPHHQIAVTLFSEKFIKGDRATAVKFMRALLRGNRDYNDAIDKGRLAGPGAEEMIAILTQYSVIKDAAIYRRILVHSADPDGRLRPESLQADLDYFRAQGLLQTNVTLADAMDETIAADAVKTLGPYKRK